MRCFHPILNWEQDEWFLYPCCTQCLAVCAWASARFNFAILEPCLALTAALQTPGERLFHSAVLLQILIFFFFFSFLGASAF